MAIVELALLYGLCGLGCAAAALRMRPRSFGDAAILVPLWPLLAPFLFLNRPNPPGSSQALGPLAELWPSAEIVAPLRARLEAARHRMSEIDALLETPSFNLTQIEARIAELDGAGAAAALASARSRKRNVELLAGRRKRLASELEALSELFLQLETQTEVVRLAGRTDDSASQLAIEIQARLEGIDELQAETEQFE